VSDAAISPIGPPRGEPSAARLRLHIHRAAVLTSSLVAVVALALLGARSFTRLETWWDAWYYHIPLAADWGGLGVPYTTSDPDVTIVREGFPPLPFLVHGILWRLTGSLNAIGVRNFMTLSAFLYFATRVLRARFALVTLVALTAPLVVIHAASTYYDLFANAFLAIGITGIAALFLFDRQEDRRLLRWVLGGLVGAAWSKIVLIPLVGIALGVLFVYYARRPSAREQKTLWWIGACALVAALPYLRNLILHHNPIWPCRIPFLPSAPSALDLIDRDTPPLLVGVPHYEIFFRSLFEIGQPLTYPSRARYVVDQGRAWAGFRSGGFWGIGVAGYLGILGTLAVLYARRKAMWLGAGVVATLVCIAFLPGSHNLRYFMFLPLSWAALIAMLEVRLSERLPLLMSGAFGVTLTLFGYMAYVNRDYFRVEQVDYVGAAASWGADAWWPALERDERYCAVNPPYPSAFFLTGPTMHEFTIEQALSTQDCSQGTVVLAWTAPSSPSKTETDEAALMTTAFAPETDRKRRIDLFSQVISLNPEHYGAHVQLARALESAGERRAALKAWRATKRLELLRGYAGADNEYSSARIRALAAEGG
jgi:hypothetical protein